MIRRFRSLAAFLALALGILACSSSFELVGTQPPPSGSLLPHTLYYLADGQVFRMERDGKTSTQLTHEAVAVGRYDVSLADGSVAYVANNQLLLINADGSDRRLLLDGGPVDPNNPIGNSLHGAVFSPDGQSIAYAYHGLNSYNLATGVSKVVMPDEMYQPVKYSPDGVKLLMTVHVPNSDATHDVIYDPATNSIVNFNYADGAFFCCGMEEWTQDSLSLYVAYPAMGILSPGLWKVDAASGNVTTLLPTDAGGGSVNFAEAPHLASDGQLYYFFANASEMDGLAGNVPLQIVRAGPDGVTGRTVLRPETFVSLNEALWAPDASLVIVAKAPSDSVGVGGALELYYIDTAKSMIPLLPSGQQLKWGP